MDLQSRLAVFGRMVRSMVRFMRMVSERKSPNAFISSYENAGLVSKG